MSVVTDTTATETGEEPIKAPIPGRTLREISENAAAKRGRTPAEEIIAESRGEAPAREEAPAPKPKAEEPFDFTKWHDAQPEEARKTFATNVYNNTIRQIQSKVGDTAFALLEEAAKDPKLKAKLDRLSDKKLRQFVFDTAYDIYGDGVTTQADGEAPARDDRYDELKGELDSIKAERENERTGAARREYEGSRTTELEALVREFPELKYDVSKPEGSAYLKVSDIIDRAEARSLKAGKVISYRDVYTDMQRAWSGTTAQRSAPSTTTETDIPSPRQAPKTDREAAARMRETLAKHGGLSGLAAALKR